MKLKDSNYKKSVSYQKKDRRGHARHPSFGMTMTKTPKVCILWPASYEMCHGKTRLKFFVDVMPKKDWLEGSHQSFFGYDNDNKIICLDRLQMLHYTSIL